MNRDDLLREVAVEVRAINESLERPTGLNDSQLTLAQYNAKRIIKIIDDYKKDNPLPIYSAGDYVFDKVFDAVSKVSGISTEKGKVCVEGRYLPETRDFITIIDLVDAECLRLATKAEIAEYEVALDFEKHGRVDFELKTGDLIAYKDGTREIVEGVIAIQKDWIIAGNIKLLLTKEEIDNLLNTEKA